MTHLMKIIPKTVAIIGIFLPALSYAAPEFFITWKASSYVPKGFAGKALPAAGTPIEASVILIDGGKAINLAPYEINWYAGEERIAGGLGATNARAIAPATGQDSLELRAHIVKYAGGPQDAFATIPVVKPEIVAVKKITQPKARGFSIIPYFWNITTPDDLTVTWDDTEDSVTARATNKKNPLEFAQVTALKQ